MHAACLRPVTVSSPQLRAKTRRPGFEQQTKICVQRSSGEGSCHLSFFGPPLSVIASPVLFRKSVTMLSSLRCALGNVLVASQLQQQRFLNTANIR
jgi:hypothetical protein